MEGGKLSFFRTLGVIADGSGWYEEASKLGGGWRWAREVGG